MSKRRPLVAANWKMYISTPEEAKKFIATLRRKARSFTGVDVVIAPSFTLLPLVAAALKGSPIRTSAQSVSVFDTGAHTGEVAAAMVKSFGATYSIIGHSERRAQGESDTMVCAQMMHAAAAGLTPILCIGESERDPAGAYLATIVGQLRGALSGFKKDGVPKLVVAYEPVWAIGKNASEAMKGAELREMSIFIKKTLAEYFEKKAAMRIPILYGGSVEASNARTLLDEGDVSGFLVGHASADVESFIDILKAVK